MKPKEKKPEIIYRIIDRQSGDAVGSLSRSYSKEYDFASPEEAINANVHGVFTDVNKYKIAKYKVTYELIEDDVYGVDTLYIQHIGRGFTDAFIIELIKEIDKRINVINIETSLSNSSIIIKIKVCIQAELDRKEELALGGQIINIMRKYAPAFLKFEVIVLNNDPTDLSACIL